MSDDISRRFPVVPTPICKINRKQVYALIRLLESHIDLSVGAAPMELEGVSEATDIAIEDAKCLIELLEDNQIPTKKIHLRLEQAQEENPTASKLTKRALRGK